MSRRNDFIALVLLSPTRLLNVTMWQCTGWKIFWLWQLPKIFGHQAASSLLVVWAAWWPLASAVCSAASFLDQTQDSRCKQRKVRTHWLHKSTAKSFLRVIHVFNICMWSWFWCSTRLSGTFDQTLLELRLWSNSWYGTVTSHKQST